MASKIDIESNGRFSVALRLAIEASGMSLTDIAQRVDSTYEHMRKLVAGRAFPSVHLLRALAQELKADRAHWQELIDSDKIYKKYPKTLPKLLGIAPELEAFQAYIPKMTADQREILLSMARNFARQNNVSSAAKK